MGYPLACQSVNSLNKAKDARAPQGVLEMFQHVLCSLDDIGRVENWSSEELNFRY